MDANSLVHGALDKHDGASSGADDLVIGPDWGPGPGSADLGGAAGNGIPAEALAGQQLILGTGWAATTSGAAGGEVSLGIAAANVESSGGASYGAHASFVQLHAVTLRPGKGAATGDTDSSAGASNPGATVDDGLNGTGLPLPGGDGGLSFGASGLDGSSTGFDSAPVLFSADLGAGLPGLFAPPTADSSGSGGGDTALPPGEAATEGGAPVPMGDASDAVLRTAGDTFDSVSVAGSGFTFNNDFVSGTSTEFQNDVIAAEQTLAHFWTNSVTVDLTFNAADFGASGFVATNSFFGNYRTYSSLKTDLQSHDFGSYDGASYLPASDPSGGGNTWFMPLAYERMLGDGGGSAAYNDDSVSLNTHYVSVTSANDTSIINAMMHEMSEGTMGRIWRPRRQRDEQPVRQRQLGRDGPVPLRFLGSSGLQQRAGRQDHLFLV